MNLQNCLLSHLCPTPKHQSSCFLWENTSFNLTNKYLTKNLIRNTLIQISNHKLLLCIINI